MTRLKLRRGLAALAVSPLLLAGLVACGDEAASDSDTGSDAGEGGVALLASLSEGEEVDADEWIDIVADGVESSTTARVRMTMTMGSVGEMSAVGELDYTTSPPETAMTMTMPAAAGMAGDLETRMVDGEVYLKMGQFSAGKWWRIDLSDPDSVLGQLGMDSLVDQTDPIGQLEKMKPGIETITYHGEEEVEGRTLDRYELTIDMAAALEASGAELPEAAKSELPETITYDAWLDEEDRFAQMSMDYPVMDQSMEMLMTMDDWGAEVDIEAPPAKDVTEMPSMEELMSGMGGAPAA